MKLLLTLLLLGISMVMIPSASAKQIDNYDNAIKLDVVTFEKFTINCEANNFNLTIETRFDSGVFKHFSANNYSQPTVELSFSETDIYYIHCVVPRVNTDDHNRFIVTVTDAVFSFDEISDESHLPNIPFNDSCERLDDFNTGVKLFTNADEFIEGIISTDKQPYSIQIPKLGVYKIVCEYRIPGQYHFINYQVTIENQVSFTTENHQATVGDIVNIECDSDKMLVIGLAINRGYFDSPHSRIVDGVGKWEFKCDPARTGNNFIQHTIIYDVAALDSISHSETKKKKGGGCADCTPPWIGYDTEGKLRVSNGITINEISKDAGLYHTEYPMIYTEINKRNHITLDYWENNGPSNIKIIQLGSVHEIGTPLGESQWLMEIYMENTKNNIENPKIQKINLIDPQGILADNYTVSVMLVDCFQEDETQAQQCLRTHINFTNAKVTESPVLVSNAIDRSNNGFNNYFNDGLMVIDPNYIEPTPEKPYKYVCNDTPLDEIMNGGTRNNCHWREQLSFWSN